MREGKVEKRNRPPKSCELCRIRKLKCNRGLPCDTCIRRGKDTQCRYALNADRSERSEDGKETVGERLKSLEDLITTLAQRGGSRPQIASTMPIDDRGAMDAEAGENAPGTRLEPFSPAKDPIATLKGGQFGDIRANYVDSSHWSSILEDIRGIREQLLLPNTSEHVSLADSLTPEMEHLSAEESPGPDLVFGRTEVSDMRQILKALPSRQICDNLVSYYFQSHHTILPILHPTKFQQEYESFWTMPKDTSPIWIGLLFAALSLAASLYEFSSLSHGRPQNNIPPAKVLGRQAELCLVLGKYTKASKHSLEALIIHLQSCYLRSKDSDVNLWFLGGAVVRLAISQGYHRDPSKLPGSFSPFEGEMRRRIWINIFQIDSLMSFQMGLPSMIPTEFCDAELPRNLDYSDFSPASSGLPQARPYSDYTPILYAIVKASVMTMFKTVVNHTRSLVPAPRESSVVLDRKIRETYERLPGNFKYRPLRQSVVDSPGIIANRTTIEMLHLKSIIVLHRQSITNRQDDWSRNACLEAAVRVLDRQVELSDATQPGGQLHEDGWMITALTLNDFILAATVICLDLTIQVQSSQNGYQKEGASISNGSDILKYLGSIKNSHKIWAAASAYSSEARIAAHALESTISRSEDYVNRQNETQTSHQIIAMASPHLSVDAKESEWDQIPEILNDVEQVDWSLLDNYSQNMLNDAIDLDSWMLDIAGLSGSS